MEPSQLLNKVLGRNNDTGGVEFWTRPERAGWLMKQGALGAGEWVLPPELSSAPLLTRAVPRSGAQASS